MIMGITVKSLIEDLKNYDPDLEICFGDRALDFYRLKDRGGCLQVEFSQQVYRDETGKIIVEEN